MASKSRVRRRLHGATCMLKWSMRNTSARVSLEALKKPAAAEDLVADAMGPQRVPDGRDIDRDHRLGHSYFLELFNIAQFKMRWYYQIIPLLMEYFYNDAEKVADIITDAFIDVNTSQVKMIAAESDFKKALQAII